MRILLHDPVVDVADTRMAFIKRLVVHIVFFQIVVEPLRDAGDAGFVRHHDFDGAVEDLLRVEDIVDFRILEDAIRVDARAGGIAFGADEGVVLWNFGLNDFTLIVCDLRDDGCVDAVGASFETDVFDDGTFERRIACAFAETDERRI